MSYADSWRADGEAFAAFTEQSSRARRHGAPRSWWFLSTAHDEHDVELTVEAAHEAFAAVAASRD